MNYYLMSIISWQTTTWSRHKVSADTDRLSSRGRMAAAQQLIQGKLDNLDNIILKQ